MAKKQRTATTTPSVHNLIFRNSNAWLCLLLYWVISTIVATHIPDCSSTLIRDLQHFSSSYSIFSPARSRNVDQQQRVLPGRDPRSWLEVGVEVTLIGIIVFSTLQAAKKYRNSCTSFGRQRSLFTLIVYSLMNSIADALAGMVSFRMGEGLYNVIWERIQYWMNNHHTDTSTDIPSDDGAAQVGSVTYWYHSLVPFFSGYMCFAVFMGQRGATLEPYFWPPHSRPEVRPGTYVPWLILASSFALMEYYAFDWSIPYFLFNLFFSSWSTWTVHPSPPWTAFETYALDAQGKVRSKLS